jgi:hypothetical protein
VFFFGLPGFFFSDARVLASVFWGGLFSAGDLVVLASYFLLFSIFLTAFSSSSSSYFSR